MFLVIVVVTIIFQSDILDNNKIKVSSRYGLSENHRLWPNGLVPIEYDSNVIDADLRIINSVLEEFSNKTCVKFKTRKDEEDYVLIRNEPNGCYSNLGRRGGEQIINLQSYICTISRGTVLHEIMHTLGFLHEHTRPDRDVFIKILWENIQQGMEKNFDFVEDELTTTFETPYDYYSVMQYNSFAFSKNPLLPTMLPQIKSGDYVVVVYDDQEYPGRAITVVDDGTVVDCMKKAIISGVVLKNQNKLSDGDIKRINLMYNCNEYML